MLARYRARVSGPLLDRIDLHVEVPRVPAAMLGGDGERGETSAAIRARVEAARARQRRRGKWLNALLPPRELRRVGLLDQRGKQLLEVATERLGLSARAYTRIVRVARTIADLAGEERIGTGHLAEAVQYRSLDRAQPRG